MNFMRNAIKIMCVVLVVSLTLTAVFFRDNGVNVASIKGKETIKPQSVENLHFSEDNELEKIASSGFIELYFDKKTSAIAVKETTENKMWHSMPKGANASIVSMEVTAADGVHYLNSQDNSVAFLKWSYNISDEGVTVVYILTDDQITANKEKYRDTDIAYRVSVNFTLRDGSLFVESSIENLSQNTKCGISSFKVLEGFGSFKNPKAEDFILVPDGCGAAIYPAKSDKAESYEFKVYGDDYSVKNENLNQAVMGAFGIKNGESAVAVIINSYEEYAKIHAQSNKNAYSSANASFAVDDVSEKGNSIYINEAISKEKISLCYKFLSGDNASYSEIASSCREQFIRNATLSASSIKESEKIPLHITLTGAFRQSAWSVKYTQYTNFSQALDIIKRIKAKGIDNICVRYKDCFERSSSSIMTALGGESGLKELYDYAFSQNISLFLDTNILTYNGFFGKVDFTATKSMQKSAAFFIEQKKADGLEENSVKYRFRREKVVSEFVSELINKTSDYPITGWCIGDAGRVLVSDYSANGTSRTQGKKTMSSQLPALANIGPVMVDTGNIYMIKNASTVINMPMSVSYQESDFYRAVPFVQSVLHGMLILSGTPINIENDLKTAELKCIEYGISPNFTCVYNSNDSKNNILFDNVVNDMLSVYSEVSKALDGLDSQRITQHAQLLDGVFCTTYSDATRIYVNYNNEKISVNGVTVQAQSFIRIN